MYSSVASELPEKEGSKVSHGARPALDPEPRGTVTVTARLGPVPLSLPRSWGPSYNGLHCSSKPSHPGALQAHGNTHRTSRAYLDDSNHWSEGRLVCDCMDRKISDSRRGYTLTHTHTPHKFNNCLRLQPATQLPF